MQADHVTTTENDDGPSAPGAGLRAFDTALSVAHVLLGVVTLIGLALVCLTFTRWGTITVDAEVEPPHTVILADGTAVASGSGSVPRSKLPNAEDSRYLHDDPTVLASVELDRDDADSRAVAMAAASAWLALVWLGLTNARGIVRAARDGRPFDERNVSRLRRVAVAVLAFPVVTWVMRKALDATIDVVPEVHVRSVGPSWWVHLLAGLAVLALAEVFREGARLRALDEATI